MLGLSGAAAATAAIGVFVVGGSATADTSKRAGATVITMEQEGKELFFEGPATVEAGTELKIKNKTNPRKVGPHTFSLVKEKDLPVTEDEIKDCAKRFKKICGAIIRWHKVNLQTGEVGRNPVEADKGGWDQLGSLNRKGDSWVAEQRKESFKQEVDAPEGKTLTFICAVHPEMQGELRVRG